ncbi:50S ribosomal protein L31, partial [Patescibacteria group bacterium]|nr:50S ribosomal protein L31 [Patescibacteria group bacterium]
ESKITEATVDEIIHVELCNKCHPFYTGEQRFVDTASRIQKFQKKQAAGTNYVPKKIKREQDRKKKESEPKSLREMLMGLK